MLLLLLIGLTYAVETALLFSAQGQATPGLPQDLTLVVFSEQGPSEAAVLAVRPSAGQIERVVPGALPGQWTLRWRAPASPDINVQFEIAREEGPPLRAEVRVASTPISTLSAPESLSLVVGAAEPLLIPVRTDGALRPEDLQVALPEGRLLGVRETAGGLELSWVPGESREVRAVVIGLRDGRSPHAPPVWVPVRIGARAPISVRTEPGSTLLVKVAGRSYGPVAAGADGTASVQVDVRPGETIGEATLEDAAGNRQRTTIPLIRNPRPSLTLLLTGPVAQGRPAPAIWAQALDAAGRPWAGEPPRCRASGGVQAELAPMGQGSWRVLLPAIADNALDLRVDCSLEDDRATASLGLPVGQGSAARVVLQVWPQELSTDMPVAQVRALLEDQRGDRLPAQGLSLSAAHGTLLETREEGGALRADLQVDPRFPDDEVIASWRPAPGQGAPWTVQIWLKADGPNVQVIGRIKDKDAHPLGDKAVQLSGGVTLRSDSNGWVLHSVPRPAGPTVFSLSCGDLVASTLYWPWGMPAAPDPGVPDLIARAPLRVNAGRVSRINLSVSPDELMLGAGARATVELLLLDRAGTPIVDEPILIGASAGSVALPVALPDGRFVAEYTPPPGMVSGTVELWVRSTRESFPETRTQLELSPRPLTWAPGASVGWVSSFGQLNAPQLGLMVDRRVELLGRPMYFRASLTHHVERQTVTDPDRGGEFDLQMRVITPAMGLVFRQERARLGLWAGAGVALAPYQLSVSEGDEELLRDWGFPLPGPWGAAGAGWRFQSGELFTELRGVGIRIQSSDLGYEGPIGGLALSVGYRIIY